MKKVKVHGHRTLFQGWPFENIQIVRSTQGKIASYDARELKARGLGRWAVSFLQTQE